jgi:hypothetical protein
VNLVFLLDHKLASLCLVIKTYQRLGGTFCLHLQVSSLAMLIPSDSAESVDVSWRSLRTEDHHMRLIFSQQLTFFYPGDGSRKLLRNLLFTTLHGVTSEKIITYLLNITFA